MNERFAQAVRHHFTHPPHTWTVAKHSARRWAVLDGDGAIIESTTTRAAAEDARRHGRYVLLWHDRTAWYLERSTDPRHRALTLSELRTVANILTDLDHPEAPAARHRAWPDAEFCDLCDLVLIGPARLCPTCDHCASDGCTSSLDDGEGFDGFCGHCADRRDHLYD
jgi:hypothetical protein